LRRGAAALGGAALAVVTAVSLNLPLQRDPIALVLPALILFLLTLMDETAGILTALLLVPAVPVLGTLVRGPGVAPAELAILSCGAGVLLSRRTVAREPVTPLHAALAVSALAGAVGGLAATLAAVPGWALSGATASLIRNLFSAGASDAAMPLRAGAVHALPLAAYLVVRRLPKAARRNALALLVAGMAIAGAWGILEAAGGPRLWPKASYDEYAGFGRVVTSLPDHNAAAVLFVVILFPAAGFALSGSSQRRAAALLAFGLIGAGLLLTGSRTAWLCVALAALALTARWIRARQALLAAGLVAAGAAVLLSAVLLPGAAGTTVRERLGSLAPRPALLALRSGRLPFWEAGGAMVAAHPLTGVGPGRVPAQFAAFRPANLPVEKENLHSWPLQCLAENGVVGGALLLLPFVAIVWLVVRAARTVHGPEAGLVPGLAAAAAVGLVSHPWLLAEVQVLFWGAAALLEREALAGSGEKRAPRLALVAAAAVLLAWGLPRLALAPGSEAGRWGWGTWGWGEGQGRYEWIGPEAGLWVDPPAAGAPLRLSVRYPGTAERVIEARTLAGSWRSVRLADGAWRLLELPSTPLERRPMLVELRASWAECPAATGSGDRRILAAQVKRP
jgi:O-antigen ligase